MRYCEAGACHAEAVVRSDQGHVDGQMAWCREHQPKDVKVVELKETHEPTR